MIPAFPQFKQLSLEDNDAVEAHTKHYPYYSDFNFSSLWCWDIKRQRELSVLNDNLVVKFTDYETGAPFLSYLGMHQNQKTINTLLDYSESVGLPAELRLMPEISVHDAHSPEISIVADRDNFDYIYLTSRMASLEGNQYKSKRQAANCFDTQTLAHGFEVLALNNPSVRDIVHSITDSWNKRRDKESDDQSILHEKEAIDRIFELSSIRDFAVGVVTTEGVPTSFTLEESVNRILSLAHFWKTANRSEGEYEYLAREMAKYFDARDIAYLNWEQDLGIEALRASKSSYRPSDFLKKFIVSRTSPQSV